jgi:hypothetical protein
MSCILSGVVTPGVDVTITIFDNFRRKNGVLIKNQSYDQIFEKIAAVQAKNFFAEIFLKSNYRSQFFLRAKNNLLFVNY